MTKKAVHYDITEVYDFLACLDDVDYCLPPEYDSEIDLEQQIAELENESVESQKASQGNVKHESFDQGEEEPSTPKNLLNQGHRLTNVTMHPMIGRNSFTNQLVETKPKRHT